MESISSACESMPTEFLEKRKFPRLPVKEGVFAVISSQYIMGKIHDIGNGGLSFENNNCFLKEMFSSKMEIYSGDGLHLKDLPFKTVAIIPCGDKNSSGSVQYQRYCIKFEELENKQQSKLEYFIQNYTKNTISRSP